MSESLNTSEMREVLAEIVSLLDGGDEYESAYAKVVRAALEGPKEDFRQFLQSNTLWGGPGSLADNCIPANPETRSKLHDLLIKLGRLQERVGLLNVRTLMWVQAFEQWRDQDLRRK